MNVTLLYIEGKLMDLYPSTTIASTFNLGDIGDLRTRYASYTNQFRLPKTANNNLVLGFANNVKSQTRKPYIKLSARIILNGVETIPQGQAIITSVTDAYNVSVYSDNFQFFDLIKGLTISEIDFGEGLITWDYSQISTVRKVTASALLAPVIQYGQLDTSSITFDMGVNAQIPSVRYKSIIETIITNAGYTYEGDIFDDEKYQSLIVGFSRDKFDFGGSFHKNREFKARKTTTQTVTNSNQVITYDITDIQDGYGMFDASTGIYDCGIATSGFSDDRAFNFGLFALVTFTVTSGTYQLHLLETGNPSFPTVESAQYTAGTYTVAIGYDDPSEFSLIVDSNATYGIRMDVISSGSCSITSATFYNKSYGNTVVYTPPKFLVQEILPDIDQSEIMKDFAIRFGILFKEKDNVLYCTRIKDIISKKTNVKGWTRKRDASFIEEIKFDLSKYSQKNNFTYPSGDEVYTEGTGDGYLSVTNDNVSVNSDFYTSIFNGTATQEVTNAASDVIFCANIPIWSSVPADLSVAFDNSPGLRILLTREKKSADPAVTYNGSPESDYLVGYFIDPNSVHQCDWQEAIKDNYTELEDSLDAAKIVIRYYLLNELDIAILDLLSPVFDDGGNYLINKVENFVPGQSTKTELIKIT